MVIAPSNRNPARIWFWLVVGALGSFGAPTVFARQVINIPAAEVIDKAEVVAIAVIEKMTEKKGECEDIRDYILRPEQALKGKLTEAMKHVAHLQSDLKTGKGCMEVSYSVPPWTKTREVGAKVIAVINYVDSLKEYRATATFDLSDLDKIKKLIGGEKPCPQCKDGFGSNCYYDKTVPGAPGFSASIHLPPEAEKVCFAIESFSHCGRCYHTYRVRQGTELVKVTEEEFKRALAGRNQACNNCLQFVQSGPG